MGWLVDTAVAFSVAASTSLLCTNSKAVLEKLASIPLLQGRSKVSTEFCPDVMKALDEWKQQHPNDAVVWEHPQSPYLRAIMEFTQNCRYRQAYETQLRREKGVSDNYPVAIPEGGVPRDKLVLPLEDGKSVEGDFYEPQLPASEDELTQEWANNFTSDQEEEEEDRTTK